MEMSVRCLLRLTRMSSMSKCQERYLGAGQTLFIDILKRIEPLESRWGVLRTDRTCPSQRLVVDPAPCVPRINVYRSFPTANSRVRD